MSLYYFAEHYEDGTYRWHFSANKEVLQDIRDEKEREAVHERDTEVKKVMPIKGGEDDTWEVVTSPAVIRQVDSQTREDGQKLYAYATKEVEHNEYHSMNVATNVDDIEALHHDDQIPGSAKEEREKEVSDWRKLGTEITLEASKPPETVEW